MTTIIASRACADSRAGVAEDVEVGPFCVIKPEVRIGRGTRLASNVCISGRVTIGAFNWIGPYASIGEAPRTSLYQGGSTRVEIGDCNIMGHGVTIHRAPRKRTGSHGSVAATISRLRLTWPTTAKSVMTLRLANGRCSAVTSMSRTTPASAAVAIVHNVTIGAYSFVGMKSKATQDVPRYLRADGIPSKVRRRQRSCSEAKGNRRDAIEAARRGVPLDRTRPMRLPAASSSFDLAGNSPWKCSDSSSASSSNAEGKHGRARELPVGDREISAGE